MVTVDELRVRVEERWAAADHPSWPAPREPMEPPRDEEYSRVTDPGRYRVVVERARLWAQVLGELPGGDPCRGGRSARRPAPSFSSASPTPASR